MKYISTRGNSPALSFIEVVTSGLAKDGGLYMPDSVPNFSNKEISGWKHLSYTELAEKIMIPYIGEEIKTVYLRKIIKDSYSEFHHPEIAPLHKLSDNKYVLELFHGPTMAFKDFALQFLGRILNHVLENKKEDVIIIGATSGDTGSAAIEGCKNCKHIELFMLHPHGKVSDVQRKQMTTVDSPNIHNLAIEGNFDDCQDMVKEMFFHPEFAGKRRLVAVNSINWVRIMAQIVYYFYAALKVGSPEHKISFAVPTGNFGDIFAGYMASKMGLPIEKLIVATNKNDILHRFFTKNDYSKKGVSQSYSPSMDIQVSSNFERLLFELYNRDGKEVSSLMDKFKLEGKLSVTKEVFEKALNIFSSHTADDDEIVNIIKNTYENNNYISDPHTATAISSVKEVNLKEPHIILATSHPAKFPAVIEKSIGLCPNLPDYIGSLFEKEEKFTKLSNNIEEVKKYIKDSSSLSSH